MSKDSNPNNKLKPSLFSAQSFQKIETNLTKQVVERDQYIAVLEEALHEQGIEIPEAHIDRDLHAKEGHIKNGLLQQGTAEEIQILINNQKQYLRDNDFPVEFYDLTMSTEVPVEREIFSISTILYNIFLPWKAFNKPKREIHIISNLTGRILPRKMTLLIGPPGSGKSVLLKGLAGRLRPLGGAKISGEVYYDGDNLKSGKFLLGKVSDYIEQGDTHEAVLTVDETMKFAWQCTTGGNHAYGQAKDNESAEVLNKDDEHFAAVNNVLTTLGLTGCKDTYVGDQMIRGVSGGQKRRVTIGEILVIPRPVKFMDCITNGLDTATAYDIIRAIRVLNQSTGLTNLISLLQPPPDVYRLFDEIILLCEGHIIYQGHRESALPYFASLGYICPDQMDEADFLQELPTTEGRRFVKVRPRIIPHTSVALATAWKSSKMYATMLAGMKYASGSDAERRSTTNPKQWFPDQLEYYASDSMWFYLKLNVIRQAKILLRDETFLGARVGQVLLVGAIAGSLFSNIATDDVSTMNGFLFNTLLFSALGSFALLPILFAQKAVFYKMKDELFFPTWTFALSQTLSLIPLQLLESILYTTIVYWSAGLSDEYNGSRFLTFILISFMFSMCIAQLFRFISAILASPSAALPLAGIDVVVMVLFSGFIQPKSLISNGWIWFYYLNPISWALKAVTVNEFASSKYDFQTCVNYPSCTETERFGDVVLDQYGNPTEQKWIWYSFAVLIAEFLGLFLVTTLALEFIRSEPAPPAPPRSEDTEKALPTESMKVMWEKIDEESAKQTKVPVNEEESKSNKVNEGEEAEKTGRVIELHPSSKRNGEDSPSKKQQIIPIGGRSNEAVYEAVPTSVKVSERAIEELPFDQVSLAFADIWYTVTLANKEDIDLLKGVNGYFEPGTMTALMGSSGAGKTTLLDVLAGRKNTGVVKGQMFLNGVPKIEGYFRKIMGYVEQFDTLPRKSTAREAIEFSAALRLASNITREQRDKWVNSVLAMLDLEIIENDLIGAMDAGGMSFEQRKRVSIGLELAANPSILFLDEPTTGLDSLAAQSLVRNIRKIAASGRSIVCTIHQPSTVIFNSFDSLLLLKRGGQTVFFGNLGENSSNLIEFFENAPGVSPMPLNVNPATWMLVIIGAGTGASASSVDYAAHYSNSTLSKVNQLHLEALITPNEGSRKIDESELKSLDSFEYNASYLTQFLLLMKRVHLTYWRTPTYSFIRHITNLIIALIFGSAYPQQMYSTYVAAVSRAAVIYITSLFCGVLAMLLVQPVVSAERPVFYREQQSRMYAVWIYALTFVLIEIPYLLLGSLSFTLPFFYIIGFDYLGDTTEKFFWYWFFNFLLQGSMLFLSDFFVALTPNEQTAQVLGGLFNTLGGLFCGFLIAEQKFPTFWLFMYWLNNFHYALEGLIMSQFKDDTTPIKTLNGEVMTAEDYMTSEQFSTWSYDHIGYDVLGLGVYLFVAISGMYLSLAYLRHDKR